MPQMALILVKRKRKMTFLPMEDFLRHLRIKPTTMVKRERYSILMEERNLAWFEYVQPICHDESTVDIS